MLPPSSLVEGRAHHHSRPPSIDLGARDRFANGCPEAWRLGGVERAAIGLAIGCGVETMNGLVMDASNRSAKQQTRTGRP